MVTKVDGTKDHATFSASGAERWLNCPGSITLSKSAPHMPESEYAAEGTKAHECFEFLLKNLGNLTKVRGMAVKTYSEEMFGYAMDAVTWIANHQAFKGATILCETRIDSSNYVAPGQFGTVDAAIVDEFGKLVVIDYKYGAGVLVDPVNNPQLIYYGLGIAEMYDYNFSSVDLVVIQPRAYSESGDTVRSFTMTIDELLSWKDKFQAGVKRCRDEPHTYKYGEKWCKFCPAATICPEIKERAFRQAEIVFADETGLEKLPIPNLIQMPNLSKALEAADKLEHWIEKVREHGMHVLMKGGEVPGFKLVEKRATRKWIDPKRASDDAYYIWGEKAFSAPELLSPAQLEKAVGGAGDFIEVNSTKKSSGFTMVADSDKRTKVNPIEKVFGVIE